MRQTLSIYWLLKLITLLLILIMNFQSFISLPGNPSYCLLERKASSVHFFHQLKKNSMPSRNINGFGDSQYVGPPNVCLSVYLFVCLLVFYVSYPLNQPIRSLISLLNFETLYFLINIILFAIYVVIAVVLLARSAF